MNNGQQGAPSQCTLAVTMGATMGAGIGGSAGTLIGGFTGYFGGHRGFGLIKHSGRTAMTMGGSFAMMMGVAQGLRACLND